MQNTVALNRFPAMRALYADAARLAPALAVRFAEAGIRAEDLTGPDALSRLPVLGKDRLLALQAEDPPFAGFLAATPEALGRVYVSPGPIFEPALAEDATGHGMDLMFRSAGIGQSDLALNTWSYHLVPAGLLFDAGLRAVGAGVIPAGPGNTELQTQMLRQLKPTVFLGSTAYFATLAERLEAEGHALPEAWSLRHAFLGGEFGDWSEKRRAIEDRYKLRTWSCYATADFGLIGYETAGDPGYAIHPDRYLQVCDPETGAPLAEGETGEIVVTTLTPGWPMIRFGTGDLTRALATAQDGGAARIAPLSGRVGAGVKIREIFVYPTHLAQLADRLPDLAEARARITREAGRETITLELLLAPGADSAAAEARAADLFRMLTRLRADRIRRVPAAAAFSAAAPLDDRKDA